jgi:hypothetical protein
MIATAHESAIKKRHSWSNTDGAVYGNFFSVPGVRARRTKISIAENPNPKRLNTVKRHPERNPDGPMKILWSDDGKDGTAGALPDLLMPHSHSRTSPAADRKVRK